MNDAKPDASQDTATRFQRALAKVTAWKKVIAERYRETPPEEIETPEERIDRIMNTPSAWERG